MVCLLVSVGESYTNDDDRFKGPKVNIQHMMLGRDENIIDGKAQEISEGSDSGSNAGSGDKKMGV